MLQIKLISKVATNEVKQHGQIAVANGNEKSFLAPLAIEKMPRIGAKTVNCRGENGVEPIRILRRIPVAGADIRNDSTFLYLLPAKNNNG